MSVQILRVNTPDLDDNDDVFIFLGLNINPI